MSDNTWIALYEPMLEITLSNWRKYYSKASNMNSIVDAMNNKKVLMLSKHCAISWSYIENVDLISQELWMVEKMIVWLPDQLQDKVKRLVKERKSQEKTVTEQYIQNIIDAG